MDVPGLGEALELGLCMALGQYAVWSCHRRVGGRWGGEGVNVILPWETVRPGLEFEWLYFWKLL